MARTHIVAFHALPAQQEIKNRTFAGLEHELTVLESSVHWFFLLVELLSTLWHAQKSFNCRETVTKEDSIKFYPVLFLHCLLLQIVPSCLSSKSPAAPLPGLCVGGGSATGGGGNG